MATLPTKRFHYFLGDSIARAVGHLSSIQGLFSVIQSLDLGAKSKIKKFEKYVLQVLHLLQHLI